MNRRMTPTEAEYLIDMGKLDPSTITDPEIHRWLSMRTVMKQRLAFGLPMSASTLRVGLDCKNDATSRR